MTSPVPAAPMNRKLRFAFGAVVVMLLGTPSMVEALAPVTRFSVMALELGWLNWTLLPWPTEKDCQLMMAFEVVWLISVLAPAAEICAWPATTEPPVGCALAPTAITAKDRMLAEARAWPRTRGFPACRLVTTLPKQPNPWARAAKPRHPP